VPVEAGETQDLGDIEVVPLVGGLSSVEASITGEELVRDLAAGSAAGMRRLHAPRSSTVGGNPRMCSWRASILRDPGHAREADIALVGHRLRRDRFLGRDRRGGAPGYG